MLIMRIAVFSRVRLAPLPCAIAITLRISPDAGVRPHCAASPVTLNRHLMPVFVKLVMLAMAMVNISTPHMTMLSRVEALNRRASDAEVDIELSTADALSP